MTNIFKPHVVKVGDKYAIRQFDPFILGIMFVPLVGQCILIREFFVGKLFEYYSGTSNIFIAHKIDELNDNHLFSSAEECYKCYKTLVKKEEKKKKLKVKFVDIEKEVSIEKFQK